MICETNSKLEQAIGNNRCYLQNKVLTIANTVWQLPRETKMNLKSISILGS